MEAGLIPHRYAMALYKYALESDTTKSVYEVMKNVIESFRSNPGLEKVLSNPFVDASDKKKLLLAAAGKNPGDAYLRFVTLILDHNREEFAYLMALAYRDIYRRENRISQVRITTAVPLPETETGKMKALVEKSFADTTFEYSEETDSSLIGGFVIDVDFSRLDASITNELEQLRQNLLRSN